MRRANKFSFQFRFCSYFASYGCDDGANSENINQTLRASANDNNDERNTRFGYRMCTLFGCNAILYVVADVGHCIAVLRSESTFKIHKNVIHFFPPVFCRFFMTMIVIWKYHMWGAMSGERCDAIYDMQRPLRHYRTDEWGWGRLGIYETDFSVHIARCAAQGWAERSSLLLKTENYLLPSGLTNVDHRYYIIATQPRHSPQCIYVYLRSFITWQFRIGIAGIWRCSAPRWLTQAR